MDFGIICWFILLVYWRMILCVDRERLYYHWYVLEGDMTLNKTPSELQVEIINELPEDKTITVYRCGPLVDLCRGPHIPSTGHVKAFSCLRVSWCSSYIFPTNLVIYCYMFSTNIVNVLLLYLHVSKLSASICQCCWYLLGISILLERKSRSRELAASLWNLVSWQQEA